jgi:hypothetical protein
MVSRDKLNIGRQLRCLRLYGGCRGNHLRFSGADCRRNPINAAFAIPSLTELAFRLRNELPRFRRHPPLLALLIGRFETYSAVLVQTKSREQLHG